MDRHNTNHASSQDKAAKDAKGADVQGSTGGDDVRMRHEAIQFALDLHRGKGNKAETIVSEASVFESYLRDGSRPTPPDPTVN